MDKKFHLISTLKKLFFKSLNSFAKRKKKLSKNLVKTVK